MENELITEKKEWIELTNDLTREIDKYRKYQGRAKTYINISNIGERKFYSIRYTGATRGSIEIDNNMIITNIILGDDKYHLENTYFPEVKQCLDKYIGMKLVII